MAARGSLCPPLPCALSAAARVKVCFLDKVAFLSCTRAFARLTGSFRRSPCVGGCDLGVASMSHAFQCARDDRVLTSRVCSIFYDSRSTCSIENSPSPLFNAVPACAPWNSGSNKIAVNLACQFLPVPSRSSAFDAGNFSYGFELKRQGDVGHFGLTIDPEIYVDVSMLESLPSYLSCEPLSAGPCCRFEHWGRGASWVHGIGIVAQHARHRRSVKQRQSEHCLILSIYCSADVIP